MTFLTQITRSVPSFARAASTATKEIAPRELSAFKRAIAQKNLGNENAEKVLRDRAIKECAGDLVYNALNYGTLIGIGVPIAGIGLNGLMMFLAGGK